MGVEEYEALKARKNRLKSTLDLYKDMKGTRNYEVVKKKHDALVEQIKTLFRK